MLFVQLPASEREAITIDNQEQQQQQQKFMAACEPPLQQQNIFDNHHPLPGSPTTTTTTTLSSAEAYSSSSSSSWDEIMTMKESIIDEITCTELFAGLHLEERNRSHEDSSSSSSSLSSPPLRSSFSSSSSQCLGSNPDGNDRNNKSAGGCYCPAKQKRQYRHSDSFSSMTWESLSLCTEGLGFESSDEVEEWRKDISIDWQLQATEEKQRATRCKPPEKSSCRKSRCTNDRRSSFPPPISSIGMNGRPWVHFKSYRQDGRFILKEVRSPEFLKASREDGRLKLHLVPSDDEFMDDDDDDDDDNYEDEM